MEKIKPEDSLPKLSDIELQKISDVYGNFYKWRSYRSGVIKHFRNTSFEEYLRISRELFWNSVTTPSEDLENLGLDLSIPFARKEVMDFLGRITSLNIKPRIHGDELDSMGLKVLQGIYKKWSFKSNQKVERFWEMLYGVVNGTVCSYVGFNNTKYARRYLESYNSMTGDFSIKEKEEPYWNDVSKEIVPIEDIYLPKIFERNFQKQGRVLWKQQMDEVDFHEEYKKYPLHKFAVPGYRIAEDSLYYRLLGGSGVTSTNKIEVIKHYDWIKDEFIISANGIWLNKLGEGSKVVASPMPFNHKMGPFTWGITGPLDEKFSYGVSIPFQVKDPHKILNTSYTLMVERELRAIDPPILSSDIESPELIFGQHKTIPVNDVNAYKEMKISEPSGQFFSMLNSLQGQMSSQAQGGDSNVIPSRQPKSAREVMSIEKLKQQSMANAVTMYYDLIRQEVLLVLKTALQFYTLEKYDNADKRTFKNLLVNDMPLTMGGVGNLRIRMVDKTKSPLELFIEAIKESYNLGKTTEIIEIPIDMIQKLEFYISSIELEPDNASEIEMANFVENVINPMINVYAPAGLASMSKIMLRHVEKLGENISDFAEDKVLNQISGNSSPSTNPQMPDMADRGAQNGNLVQSMTGTKFGLNNNKGLPI